MGLKTSQNINFRPFLVFFSIFVATEFLCAIETLSSHRKTLLRQGLLRVTKNFVKIEFYLFDIKLCPDRVFSVATEFFSIAIVFFVQHVCAITYLF